MAVIMAPRGRGLLGTMGTIAGLGGSLFGAPWLSALGMGANAANAAAGGNPGGMAEVMGQIAGGEYGGMQSPMASPIAYTDEANAMRGLQQAVQQANVAPNVTDQNIMNYLMMQRMGW